MSMTWNQWDALSSEERHERWREDPGPDPDTAMTRDLEGPPHPGPCSDGCTDPHNARYAMHQRLAIRREDHFARCLENQTSRRARAVASRAAGYADYQPPPIPAPGSHVRRWYERGQDEQT